MCKCKGAIHATLVLVLLAPALLLAQDARRTPPPASTGPQSPSGRRGGEPPCFKQAGVSDSTWQQIMGIHKSTHQQVVAICENTSLSAQQKKDQIRQSRRQAEQQVHGLLSPQQQEAVKQCRQQRREERGERTGGMHRGMRGGGGGDPCARILRQNNKGQSGAPEQPEASEPPQQ